MKCSIYELSYHDSELGCVILGITSLNVRVFKCESASECLLLTMSETFLGVLQRLSSKTRLNAKDTCGSPVKKCLCFFVVFFFSSATKWKNCAIAPRGHWALNTMTTNCDSMRCSHADHACYLDDD